MCIGIYTGKYEQIIVVQAMQRFQTPLRSRSLQKHQQRHIKCIDRDSIKACSVCNKRCIQKAASIWNQKHTNRQENRPV
jgi:hypothetical protein